MNKKYYKIDYYKMLKILILTNIFCYNIKQNFFFIRLKKTPDFEF